MVGVAFSHNHWDLRGSMKFLVTKPKTGLDIISHHQEKSERGRILPRFPIAGTLAFWPESHGHVR